MDVSGRSVENPAYFDGFGDDDAEISIVDGNAVPVPSHPIGAVEGKTQVEEVHALEKKTRQLQIGLVMAATIALCALVFAILSKGDTTNAVSGANASTSRATISPTVIQTQALAANNANSFALNSSVNQLRETVLEQQRQIAILNATILQMQPYLLTVDQIHTIHAMNTTLGILTAPTPVPTSAPTGRPTMNPTDNPTASPTYTPTGTPTHAPTHQPTGGPTTAAPTRSPTQVHTRLTLYKMLCITSQVGLHVCQHFYIYHV